ncbi:sensor histidine kinase [Bauldia litoralis]|uniref:histidine kinase n=1 Tax=Bauldia litoralis TaxID=665467 RepID=A0A1G6CGL8_9HYPH|nr:HAMP domain-containing sensor histidine kinase [Bauldia litoralis]SDB31961.1 two-component system, cell cycle sensor histidine kinase PleC [Bauldia litoralis]
MTAIRSSRDGDKTAINRKRAEHRNEVRRTVSAQRERLTSMTGTKPAFDYELLLTFAQNRLSAALVVPLLVAVVSAAAMIWLGIIQVLAWAAVMLAVHFRMYLFCRHFSRLPIADVAVRRWTGRFISTEFVGGVAWAALFLLVPAEFGSRDGVDIFLFATALIAVAATTMLASTIPVAAVAGTIPVTATLAIVYLTRGDILFVALAVMAIGAQCFFLILATRLYSATLTMHEYRAEKDLLIAELGTAKAVSDESRRRAEEANLAKSRFLATMSHELRTPLNAILGFSEVMKSEVLGPIDNENYRDYAANIHESGQHLLNLINEILDLSRIEAGHYELYEEPVNLISVVEECCHLLQLKARGKNLEIVQQYRRDMPRIWADDRAIRQIVLNLVSNAIKFTPPGGEITVRAGPSSDGGQFISIRDNGPGIPEEEIPIVLTSFGQGAIAIKSTEQGAGLGLPIVQALVRMHEGAFELKSKLRVGTEVIATFPQSRVMEALPPIEDEPRRSRWLRVS